MQKKGQGWSFDIIVGSTIFLIAFFIFFLYTLNLSQDKNGNLEQYFYEGNALADDLLSEGYPLNWDVGSVQKIGILSERKMNKTKLDNFYSLVIGNYENTRSLFGITKEYYITFSANISVGGNIIEGIGKKPVNPANLVKTSRITIYNNSLVVVDVEIW